MSSIIDISSHYLYLIAESSDGPCKIGKTWDIEGRLAALQVGNPRQLFVAHSVAFPYIKLNRLEKKAHNLAARYHLRGEWFNCTVEEGKAILEQIKKTHFGKIKKRLSEYEEWCEAVIDQSKAA